MGCGQSQVEDVNVTKNEEEKIENKPQNPPERRKSSVHVDATVSGTAEESESRDYSVIRLLLLGAAESGKTTLLEQIRLLYNQNYSESELFHRRAFMFNNILQAIRCLITRMQQIETDYANPDNKALADLIMSGEDTQYSPFNCEISSAIQNIWQDAAVQSLYNMRSEMNLNDSTKYFLDNIELINKSDYQPTPKDLIMSYVPTVGVQNVIFNTNKKAFQLFDIGGQRIDRRKWATMYDGIDAIFFCLAISEYNQTMNEDLTTNRLTDSLNLLSKISQENKFKNIPLFLFLNEVDVFREKLEDIPLNKYQPDYSGSSAEEALDFMEELAMKAVGERETGLLFVYRTTCVDTQEMSQILEKVFKTILSRK